MNCFRLFLIALLLAACGRAGSNGSSNNSQMGYPYHQNGYSYGPGASPNLPALGGGSAYGSDFTGQFLEGTGEGGTLSSSEISSLQDAISKLSENDKSQMQFVLLNNLRQCSFRPQAVAVASACRSGSGQACAAMVSGYTAAYFNFMLTQMSATDRALLQYMDDEASSCASVDLSNTQAVQRHIDSKREMCRQGQKRGCAGLLMFLGRLFMRAIGMALGILSSAL